MKTADLIRKLFATFDARDRESFDALLADDFTFSSPLDDRIDKTAYFERCWPTGEHHTGHEIETIFAQGDAAFVTYSCVRTDGTCFRNTEFFRVKSGLVAQVEVYFGSETAERAQEAELRTLLEQTSAAVRAKDAAALISRYAADVVAFDVVDPLQYRGRDEVKRRAEEWLASWRGPIRFEMRDLVFSVSAESAFCHSLNHVAGTKKDGEDLDMWWRATTDGRVIVGPVLLAVGFDRGSGAQRLGLGRAAHRYAGRLGDDVEECRLSSLPASACGGDARQNGESIQNRRRGGDYIGHRRGI
jgi:ketosteroid isomerase-like protein